MMSEKIKRNPRRQLLLRLLLGLGILVALIAASVTALRPQSAQIVYIAPDDNGVDQVWLVSLNNFEHPRQLLSANICNRTWTMSGNSFFYQDVTSLTDCKDNSPFYRYDSQSRSKEVLDPCGEQICDNFNVSPDGQWMTYFQIDFTDNELTSVALMIYHIETREIIEVTNVTLAYDQFALGNRNPIWVSNNQLLVFPIERIGDNGMFDEMVYAAYDIKQRQIIDYEFIKSSVRVHPSISADGNYYAIPEDPNTGQIIYGVGIYETDTKVRIFREEQSLNGTSFLAQLQVIDWHPSESILLVTETWQEINTGAVSVNLKLYDAITTAETYLLTDDWRQIYDAQFNYDGSLLLLSSRSHRANEIVVSVINLETGEETILPISEHSPQWVNGGR